jgi:amidase
MGMLDDIHMPIGITFAGRAYDDTQLLRAAYAFEQTGKRRCAAPRTPPLADDGDLSPPRALPTTPLPRLNLAAELSAMDNEGMVKISVSGKVNSDTPIARLDVWVNGEALQVGRDDETFHAAVRLPFATHYALHSRWRGPYGSLVTALAQDQAGGCAAAYVVVGGI